MEVVVHRKRLLRKAVAVFMAQQDFVIFLVGEIFEGGGRHGVVGFGFEAAELDFDLFHDSQPLVQVV